MEGSPIIDGRECGTCTLCCKVLSITELEKPQGQWCRHAKIGEGCSIYGDRPSECRTFYCGYLSWAEVGEHWQPAKCKMVIVAELDGERIEIHVDPGRPAAWRDAPYYDEIKNMAEAAAAQNMQVIVSTGGRAIAILPDRDVDLGVVAPDERIVTGIVVGHGERRYEAMKMKADDPRIAGMVPGKPVRFSIPRRY